MHTLMQRISSTLLVLSVCALAVAQDPPAKTKPEPAKSAEPMSVKPAVVKPGPKDAEPAPKPPATVDQLKTFANAVIVVCGDLKEAMTLTPRMIILRPEKYEELLDRIRTLELQLKPRKVLPTVTRLTARVEGEFALVQIEYQLVLEAGNVLVQLGGQGGHITDPDTRLILSSDGEGYTAMMPTAGEQRLTLQLRVPLKKRRLDALVSALEHSFELGLPGAAVTTLQLELPKSIREVRWNDIPEKPASSNGAKSTWDFAVGKVKQMKVQWLEPVALPQSAAPPRAEWDVQTVVQENQVSTTAQLKLHDRQSKTAQWRLLLPPESRVELEGVDSAAYEIGRPDKDGVVLIKGPAVQSLQITVSVNQPRPFTRLPIGPFAVLGMDLQEGAYVIQAAPEVRRGLSLSFLRSGALQQQDVPPGAANGDIVARFKSWDMAQVLKAPKTPKGAPPAQLELEFKNVPAQVKAAIEHTLVLRLQEQQWVLTATSTINVTPTQTSIDYLDVLLPLAPPQGVQYLPLVTQPAGAWLPWHIPQLAEAAASAADGWTMRGPSAFELRSRPPLAELQTTPGQRKARIDFGRAKLDLGALKPIPFALKSTPFELILKCDYTFPAAMQEFKIELPQPLTQLLDTRSKIQYEIDAPHELLVREADGLLVATGKHQYTVYAQNMPPTEAAFGWRPFRPDIQASILADAGFVGRALRVRQQLKLDFSEKAPGKDERGGARTIYLKRPRNVEVLKVVSGGKLSLLAGTPNRVRVEGVTREPVLLEYEVPLPPAKQNDTPQQLTLPLLWPEEATRADSKVRFWTEPGVQLALQAVQDADLTWRESAQEVVPGRDSLPALVVRSEDLDAPLGLSLRQAASTPFLATHVDRGLLQVKINEEGNHDYRARFVLSKLASSYLDITLPAPAAQTKPQVMLDGKIVPWHTNASDAARIHCPINPALYTRQVSLEIAYQLPPDNQSPGPFQIFLQPPLLDSKEVYLGRLRWQISAPANDLVFPIGDHVPTPLRWSLRGWLLTPEPAVTAQQLDQWINPREDAGDLPSVSMVTWVKDLTPLRVVVVSRQMWWLFCSLVVLVVGIGLSMLQLTRLGRWLACSIVGGSIIFLSLYFPIALTYFLHGAQPGLVVLLLLLFLQWLLHQRYRNQVVFMPGFARLKPGSSLMRTSVALKEPSTVDAPAQPRPGSTAPREPKSNPK